MKYDLDWLYDIYILELWHVISIVLAVFLLVYIYLNSRRTALFYHYAVLQAILLNWLISKAFKTVAPTADLKWFFIVMQYATVCFLGSALLMFAYLYATGRSLPPRIAVPLNIPPLVFFLVVATNENHHLFYATYDFLGDTFGPLFYAYSVMTYLYIAVGLYYCTIRLRKELRPGSVEAKFLVAGIAIPLFFNALYVARLMKPRFDITPVTYSVSLSLFAYAVHKHRFLDVVPAGVSAAFNNLREGVLVYDDSGMILDRNDAFFSALGLRKGTDYRTVGEIEENLGIARDLAGALKERRHGDFVYAIAGAGEENRHLTVRVHPAIPSAKKPWGYTCVIHDDTDYLKLIEELEEKNQLLALANAELEAYGRDLARLAAMEERSRMAKEIHDILGHSLTLVLNIMESAEALIDRDMAGARLKVDQALAVAKTGLIELQAISWEGGHEDTKPLELLVGEIEALAARYHTAGMTVHLDIKGPRKSIPTGHYHALYRVCQESLTNALRHGRAEAAHVFIRMNLKEIEVFVLDNGRGCEGMTKGHGINGMEQRVRELGGTFSCGPGEEGGFTVHARFPCRQP